MLCFAKRPFTGSAGFQKFLLFQETSLVNFHLVPEVPIGN